MRGALLQIFRQPLFGKQGLKTYKLIQHLRTEAEAAAAASFHENLMTVQISQSASLAVCLGNGNRSEALRSRISSIFHAEKREGIRALDAIQNNDD